MRIYKVETRKNACFLRTVSIFSGYGPLRCGPCTGFRVPPVVPERQCGMGKGYRKRSTRQCPARRVRPGGTGGSEPRPDAPAGLIFCPYGKHRDPTGRFRPPIFGRFGWQTMSLVTRTASGVRTSLHLAVLSGTRNRSRTSSSHSGIRLHRKARHALCSARSRPDRTPDPSCRRASGGRDENCRSWMP